MSIKEKLKGLLALQKVDLEVLELQRAGDVHPKRLAELDAQLAAARAKVESERSRLGENERLRRDKESEVQSEKEKIKKWEARLAEQRTTREYAALAREIDIAKKAVLNLDEELKGLVEIHGEIKKAMGEREGEFNRLEDASAAERAGLKEQIDSLSEQIEGLTEKREELAKHVEPDLLARYDSIRKGARGAGLAAVVGGTCRGCNMRIRPQLYNILRAEATIEACPSCHRLIYAAETLES